MSACRYFSPRRFARQTNIDHEKISGAIVLQKFDRTADHIRKARLFAARFHLIRVGEFRITEDTEKPGSSPARDRLEFRFRPNEIKTIAPNFQQ